MIEGYFGSEDRPYLRARVHLTRLGRTINVTFMIDTGADSTSVGSRDWRAARLTPIDFNPPSVTITGFGGSVTLATERAEILLEHGNGQVDRIAIDVEIGPGNTSVIPSVLGRDALRRYRLICSPIERILTLERVG